MPYKNKADRDTKHEYAVTNGKPAAIKKRSANNAARAAVEKKLGHALPTTMEVHHKKPLAKGGSNKTSNLAVISRHSNRVKKP